MWWYVTDWVWVLDRNDPPGGGGFGACGSVEFQTIFETTKWMKNNISGLLAKGMVEGCGVERGWGVGGVWAGWEHGWWLLQCSIIDDHQRSSCKLALSPHQIKPPNNEKWEMEEGHRQGGGGGGGGGGGCGDGGGRRQGKRNHRCLWTRRFQPMNAIMVYPVMIGSSSSASAYLLTQLNPTILFRICDVGFFGSLRWLDRGSWILGVRSYAVSGHVSFYWFSADVVAPCSVAIPRHLGGSFQILSVWSNGHRSSDSVPEMLGKDSQRVSPSVDVNWNGTVGVILTCCYLCSFDCCRLATT